MEFCDFNSEVQFPASLQKVSRVMVKTCTCDGTNFLGKEVAPPGANSFLKKLAPFRKVSKALNGQFASPGRIPIYLESI